MVKYNYFENLEKLSSLSLSAVSLACGTDKSGSIVEIRKDCDRLVCATEDALFSDFLPPLERNNIAGAAHCLSRVVDRASDLLSDAGATPSFMCSNEEAAICVGLAKELDVSVALLRQIRRPDEMPDTEGFRKMLCDARHAHKNMLSKIRTGTLSRSSAEAVILTGRLRSELSHAFDEIVEIMLNNI